MYFLLKQERKQKNHAIIFLDWIFTPRLTRRLSNIENKYGRIN